MLNQTVFLSVLFFTCRAQMTEGGGFHPPLSIRCLQKGLAMRGLNTDSGILDPDRYPDLHQNLTDWSLGQAPLLRKISSKSVWIPILIRIPEQWLRILIRIATNI